MKNIIRVGGIIIVTLMLTVFTTGCILTTEEESKRGEKLQKLAKKAAVKYISEKYDVIPKIGEASK